MTARDRGDYFERQCRTDLESQGWYVMRSAGSFGLYDLVALKDGHKPVLVQCKATGKITQRALGHAWVQAAQVGASFVLAQRAGRGVIRWTRLDPQGHKVWCPDGQPAAT